MHLWCSYPSLDIEDAIASFTVRHFSLQFGCFRSSGGISGTTSLYSRTNGKNCSKTTRSSRSNEIAGCGVSLSTMTAITVDRFFALHYHLQHPNLMKTSRAIYTIITIRFIITLFSFSILWSPRIYYFLVPFFITICLLVCLVCFIKITELFSGISCKFTFNNKQWKIQLIQINSKYDKQLRVQKISSYISSSWFYSTLHHFLFIFSQPLII